jgi:hypothetical protein
MYGTRCDRCGRWSDGEPAVSIVVYTYDGDDTQRVRMPIDLCEDCSPAVVEMLAAIARTERTPHDSVTPDGTAEIIMSMGESRVGTEHDGSEGWVSESDG